MDINNQEPNIDESDVKTTLSTDLTELEKRTEKEEETAEKTQDFLEKKKAELERRRQEAENKKKEARKEIKEIKKELKESDSEEDSDTDDTKTPAQHIDEDAQFEAFKARLKEEQDKESLQKSVDELLEKYPDASAESLQKIETLAAELKQHYPNLTPEQLVAKATYLELGESSQDEGQNTRVDASAPPSGGSNQKSKSLSYMFQIKEAHKKALKTMGLTEEEYLKDIKKRYDKGEDISKYGVIKVK